MKFAQRDKWKAKRFYHPQKLQRLNDLLTGSESSTCTIPDNEIEGYRLNVIENRFRKVYDRNSTFQFLDSVGLGDAAAYVLNHTINRGRIQHHLYAENLRDKIDTKRQEMISSQSPMYCNL